MFYEMEVVNSTLFITLSFNHSHTKIKARERDNTVYMLLMPHCSLTYYVAMMPRENMLGFIIIIINISDLTCLTLKKKKKENARGSFCSVLLAFSQSYVKHDLRKNKIAVASITDFFRH
jgi:hypothetical protein